MQRDDLLRMLSTHERQQVEVPGLGLLTIRPLRLSEVLQIWERAADDSARQLGLIAAAVLDDSGAPLASADEWDQLLGLQPGAWAVLGAAVNRAQGFNEEETQGN